MAIYMVDLPTENSDFQKVMLVYLMGMITG
jgi:hypothetical protein